MRLFTLLLGITISTLSFAQGINFKIEGSIFNSGQDSVHLAQFFGDKYSYYHSTKLKKDGEFKFKGTLPNPDYYILKVGDKHINVIIRDSSDIKIYADGGNLENFVNFIGSDESSSMFEYIQILNKWTLKSDSALRILEADPSKRNDLNKEMGQAYNVFRSQQQAFVSKNQNSAALYPVLNSIDPNVDFATYEALVSQLNQGFGESPTIKNVQFNLEQLQKEKYKNDPLAPGKMAPDFEEMMPDSTMMKLSDLKGKVVLLDFWASWCGPCRRENPNVVNLYNQYKEDGFTVLSVSLDKDRERWLQAIEKDGLVWPFHVSDLLYWSSKPAKLYGVRGIPFTVLIDQEGKIIRTKLRGEDLHNELKRIFGH